MNILPHKSWHVYNKKNIEKVKRDEAKAQEEEAAKAERAIKAESEARLNLLRQRAESRYKQLDDSSASTDGAVVKKPPEHVVLFGSDQGDRYAKNEEREAEEKEKEAKLDRQLTMYLDKGVKESTPWYAVKEYDRYGETKPDRSKDTKAKEKRRKRAIHLNEDPLAEIQSKMAKREEARKERRYGSYHRHHKEKSKKTKSASPSSSSSSSSSSIEALRAKRLQREQAERMRTKAYVFGEVPDIKPPDTYHSQFNPTETAEAHERRRRRR
ncbi:predicted protein [Lichtheimia corymbifera JMRC:FSU:9682]|uniref:CBF1-interacting co-repressor CIR N-terminal domain-containing protein n=1 Tax=Lichtheimia corymbifera JMRC:FSU:9682 TaxID=1263082 RepID=A0A068SE80_9FUNG|nr:predicted protein [Lichtheimia corymbifera JMRC:FSU:9682]